MDEKDRRTPSREEMERAIRQGMKDMSYAQLRRLLAFAHGMKTKRSGF